MERLEVKAPEAQRVQPVPRAGPYPSKGVSARLCSTAYSLEIQGKERKRIREQACRP